MRILFLAMFVVVSTAVQAGGSLPSLLHGIKNHRALVSTNAVVAKFQRGVLAGTAAIVIACGSLGCSEDYDRGDRVYFVRDGVAYGAEVQRELDDGDYLVRVNDTSTVTTVDKDEIAGEHDADGDERELEGARVVLDGDGDKIKYRRGILKRFYDNNYVEIRITHEVMFNDDVVKLAEPYTIFVRDDISLQEGGFEVGDFF